MEDYYIVVKEEIKGGKKGGGKKEKKTEQSIVLGTTSLPSFGLKAPPAPTNSIASRRKSQNCVN